MIFFFHFDRIFQKFNYEYTTQDYLYFTEKIFCYFNHSAFRRKGNGQMDIAHIDPTLCTHLVYTYAGLTYYGHVKILDRKYDLLTLFGGFSGYKRFNKFNKSFISNF